MDKDYNGRSIFVLGGKAEFLPIPQFPPCPWNRPGQQRAKSFISVLTKSRAKGKRERAPLR